MVKGKIIGVKSFEGVYQFLIKKQTDVHGLFCCLLKDFGLSEENIGDIDIIFDDLVNEYIYIEDKKTRIEIHFFITSNLINFVIKTDTSQIKINTEVKKYFNFI